MSVRKKIVH